MAQYGHEAPLPDPDSGSYRIPEDTDSTIAESPAHGFAVARRMRFLRGEPVTEPMPIADALRNSPYRHPATMSAPEKDAGTRKALDLAVRVGELLLRCGAGTRDVEASVVAVAAAAGLRRLEVDITNQSLLVQAPGPSGETVTMLRVVRSSTRDFARLTDVHVMVQELTRGGFTDIDEALGRLKRIQRSTRIYPRWLIAVGYSALAGSVCALLGGGSMAIVVAVLSAFVTDYLGRLIRKRNIPSFYIDAVGSAVSVMLAWLGYLLAAKGDLGLQMSTADFAYAVSGGLVVLLPGRAMASAVEDAITGYPVTGAGRLLTVFLSAAGIIVGVAGGLSLTLKLDSALNLQLTSPGALHFGSSSATLSLQFLYGAVGAAAGALTMRSRPRFILPTAVLGSLALGLSGLAHLVWAVGATTSIAVASVSVGVLARVIGLRLGAPALVLVLPAVSPMLPGLRIFEGMYDAIVGSVIGSAASNTQSAAAFPTLLGAAGVALAISTGVVLGDVLAAPLDRNALRRRRARIR
ncbi:threonine/serine exporter ThrE family protein [Allobranchiibius sp. GilTou73]|uniref:threonine/serine ThrE exporter family protein n=1 Tax=Allobranchiibius sp. GilTou73 TaxID=2904523 RepID=UPI001F1C85C8|nr:threonine/serine exporter family protein [Allobranchiibius sp. GilTou73]UIJ36008.1 threonine/serine exporter family protein [Allobranchiibius sp. GilTou73]